MEVQYRNFESEKTDNSDFTVYIGKFTPTNHNCYIVDKYYVKKHYFYCKQDAYKAAKWEFEISKSEKNGTIIRISSNLVGELFISGFIMDSLIRFKMNEKGYSIVHASCVSKNNQAFLFPASSGGGKTTTALYFVEKRFDFLGDNFVILHDGNVLSFLSSLSIFTYNLASVIEKNLGTKKKIILSLKHLLYRATSGYIKIFTKINPKDAFPNLIANESKLNYVLLLIPKQNFRIKRIGKDELINHLITNQKSEFFPFFKYMLEYSYIFPDSEIGSYWEKYKENLRNNLPEDIPFYKIEVPQRYDKEVFEKILEVIK